MIDERLSTCIHNVLSMPQLQIVHCLPNTRINLYAQNTLLEWSIRFIIIAHNYLIITSSLILLIVDWDFGEHYLLHPLHNHNMLHIIVHRPC